MKPSGSATLTLRMAESAIPAMLWLASCEAFTSTSSPVGVLALWLSELTAMFAANGTRPQPSRPAGDRTSSGSGSRGLPGASFHGSAWTVVERAPVQAVGSDTNGTASL